jgi:PAS domain-containing protein
MNKALAGIERLANVRRTAQLPETLVEREASPELVEADEDVFKEKEPGPAELEAALHQVGKYSKDDELNCGGCGYDSCRNFARALALGRAETAMCASYMRKLATNKANALLKSMPCGVVIVDSEMKIVECNRIFAEMLDEGARMAFEARPGLAGANIHKMVDFGDLFKEALDSGREIERHHFRMGGRLCDLSVFSIEPGKTVGATVEDVTGTEVKREQIAKKAKEVSTKNLAAVQDIAWRLGEHMADTEILLRSIADDYSSDAPSGQWKDVTGSVKDGEDEP